MSPAGLGAHKAKSYKMALLRDLLRNRWVGLAAASWIEVCAGVAYMFSLYSQSFKATLGYNQTMVDMVGLAKDVGGNVGIVSGFVGDNCAPWVTLTVGAAQNAVGYAGVWLILTGRVPAPPLWVVMSLMCFGTNGATFFNTGGMVTCVKNFPHSRGPVVGLLKGFIGLSGALFAQLYLALYAPHTDSFLLMCAWCPALIVLLMTPAVHILPPSHEPHERAHLFLILLSSIAVALFLLGASLLVHFVSVPRWVCLGVAAASLAVLASPLLVGLRQNRQTLDHSGGFDAQSEQEQRLVPGSAGEDEAEEREEWQGRGKVIGGERGGEPGGDPVHAVRFRQRSPSGIPEGDQSGTSKDRGGGREADEESEKENLKKAGSTPSLVARTPTHHGYAPGLTGVGPSLHQQGDRGERVHLHPLQVGDDHSLIQASMTVSFWLIYLAMTGASGSGLTAINNLGQLGRSLGYGQDEIGIFVSLMSIWNFLGRVGAGYVSEYFLQERGVPRPVFMVLTQLTMSLGHLLFASALPGSLYFGSVVVGLCYGAQWGLMPAVASEVFGLRYFGTIYNWLTITNPTGSYLLSVCVAGYLYDYEAEQEAAGKVPGLVFSLSKASAPLGPAPGPAGGPPACHGAHCFRDTFLVMAGACFFAACMSMALCYITAKYYASEHSRRKPVLRRSDSSTSDLG